MLGSDSKVPFLIIPNKNSPGVKRSLNTALNFLKSDCE